MKRAILIGLIKIILFTIVFFIISRYLQETFINKYLDFIFEGIAGGILLHHFIYYDYKKNKILDMPRRFGFYNQYEKKYFNFFKLSFQTEKVKDYDTVYRISETEIHFKNKSVIDITNYEKNILLIKQYLGVDNVKIIKNGENSIYLQILKHLPDFVKYDSKTMFKQGKIFFGMNEEGNPFFKDILTLSHLLIAGTAGSGKSVFTFLVLSSLLKNINLIGHIFLIDFKVVSFSKFKGKHKKISVGTTHKELYEFTEKIMKEHERRLKYCEEKKISDYPDNPIYIFFDEYAQFIDTAPDKTEKEEFLMYKKTLKNLEQIAQVGRSNLLRLIIITQKPEAKVLSTKLKSNIQSRIMLKVKDKITERQILDKNVSDDFGITDFNTMPKGRFIFMDDNSGETGIFQSPFINVNNYFEEIELTFDKETIEEKNIVIDTSKTIENDLGNDKPRLKEENVSYTPQNDFNNITDIIELKKKYGRDWKKYI